MDYTFTASGSIRVGGCTEVEAEYFFISRFEVRDTVYNRPKALRGVLRKHVIKEIVGFLDKHDPWGARPCVICNFPPLYIDTYNQFHNEEDLVTYDEALELIEEAQLAAAAALEDHAIEGC